MIQVVMIKIGWLAVFLVSGIMVEKYASEKYSAKCKNCKYRGKNK
jgi:hypothetical protein